MAGKRLVTTVVNLTKKPFDIRIDRRSIYGNPFVIGKDGDRKEVIRKFEVHFYQALALDRHGSYLDDILKLQGKRLGCHCKPLACHGDVYVRFLDVVLPERIKNDVRRLKSQL